MKQGFVPCEDDKPKYTEITLFQAGSDYSLSANHGGGATGWSRAWIINFYARLKDGENALNHLYQLMKLSTAENLFDMHPPFQIDGNFGAVSGICEMLVQSHLGMPDERIIELLPALPEKWTDGELKGIKARGNFELDVKWSNGSVTYLAVTSLCQNTFRLKLSETMKNILTDKDYSIENNVLIMDFAKGEKAEIIFRQETI